MLEFEQVHRLEVVRVTFWASWKFAADVTTNGALWIARSWIEIVVNYAHRQVSRPQYHFAFSWVTARI